MQVNRPVWLVYLVEDILALISLATFNINRFLSKILFVDLYGVLSEKRIWENVQCMS